VEQGNQPEFEADVQIGKGLRFIDRNGSAAISEGRLTLRKRNGDIVAEAPVTEVHADTARLSGGGAARIWIGTESYSVEPLRISRALPAPQAAALNLAEDVKQLKKGRELTQHFLSVLEAAGGRLGKP